MKKIDKYRQALEHIIHFNGDMSLISGIFQIKNIARNALNDNNLNEKSCQRKKG